MIYHVVINAEIYTKPFIHSNFSTFCHNLLDLIWKIIGFDLKNYLDYEKGAFINLVASHFVKPCHEERPNQNEYNLHNCKKKSDKFYTHFPWQYQTTASRPQNTNVGYQKHGSSDLLDCKKWYDMEEIIWAANLGPIALIK